MNQNISNWLPTTVKEMKKLEWEKPDVILFSGDAYIDHPSFGPAVIARLMESEGLKVAIVAQPNWTDDLRDFKKFGKPNLFFAVSAGSMDSMVNHYTAGKRKRSTDAYTPGGRAGARPDYATDTYCSILKKLYPDAPIVIGGIEASLRRVTHYDYWSDRLRPSILVTSGADLLIYGMGEKPMTDFLRLVKRGVPISSITNVAQTAFVVGKDETYATSKKWKKIDINSHEKCLSSKKAFASNFKVIEEESNRWVSDQIVQPYGDSHIVINPTYAPMSSKEVDRAYDLPYNRVPHPKYSGKGDIPAFEMIKNSINIHRGCFGGCSFCTISAHQGKFISSRSEKSIMKELNTLVEMPYFKGNLSDLGGPSANMFQMRGKDISICKVCRKGSCIFPKVCNNLNNDHAPITALYEKVESNSKVRNLYIGSGIRYDMVLDSGEANLEYIKRVVQKNVSGRLKVAPEHSSDKVLNAMRKPSFNLFVRFKKLFDKWNDQYELNQQLIPYFISSHPDCDLHDMVDLAKKTKELGYRLEQIQDFTPTPMTLSTVKFYSGLDPYTLKPVKTSTSKEAKLNQRALFFWYKREYKGEVTRLLKQLKYHPGTL